MQEAWFVVKTLKGTTGYVHENHVRILPHTVRSTFERTKIKNSSDDIRDKEITLYSGPGKN